MYILMNCLNSFLVNSRVRVRVILEKLKIAESGILEALLPCAVASQEIKN